MSAPATANLPTAASAELPPVADPARPTGEHLLADLERLAHDQQRQKRLRLRRIGGEQRPGADLLAVACPFCMNMLEDGVANEKCGQEMKVRDIAELLQDQENS